MIAQFSNSRKSGNMRSIKELLQVMLKHKDKFRTGLCLWAFELHSYGIITVWEFRSLDGYIKNNPPNYFSWTNFIRGHKPAGYFFHCGKIKPRIYWIKRHIKKNS